MRPAPNPGTSSTAVSLQLRCASRSAASSRFTPLGRRGYPPGSAVDPVRPLEDPGAVCSIRVAMAPRRPGVGGVFVGATLREHRANQRVASTSGLVLTDARGEPVWHSRRYRRLLRQAGIRELTFHEMRRTAATLMLAAGKLDAFSRESAQWPRCQTGYRSTGHELSTDLRTLTPQRVSVWSQSRSCPDHPRRPRRGHS